MEVWGKYRIQAMKYQQLYAAVCSLGFKYREVRRNARGNYVENWQYKREFHIFISSLAPGEPTVLDLLSSFPLLSVFRSIRRLF